MKKLMIQSCSSELLEFQGVLYTVPLHHDETFQFLESLNALNKLLFTPVEPRSIMLVSCMAAFGHCGLEPVGKCPGLQMPGGLGMALDRVLLSFSEGHKQG